MSIKGHELSHEWSRRIGHSHAITMGLCDELGPVDGIDFWSTTVATRVPHTAASLMGVSHCVELAVVHIPAVLSAVAASAAAVAAVAGAARTRARHLVAMAVGREGRCPRQSAQRLPLREAFTPMYH